MSRSVQHEGLSKKTAYPGVIRVRMTRDSENKKYINISIITLVLLQMSILSQGGLLALNPSPLGNFSLGSLIPKKFYLFHSLHLLGISNNPPWVWHLCFRFLSFDLYETSGIFFM